MHSVDLTDKGNKWLADQMQDDQLFVLPDITAELSELEANKSLSDEERVARKDALLQDYAIKSERVHTILQLLKAYTMFRNNEEYVVMDGQVKSSTNRPDVSWKVVVGAMVCTRLLKPRNT